MGLRYSIKKILLIVLSVDLEEALRMVADGAYFRSILADHDVTTVAALPDALIVAREDDTTLDVAHELLVALLVMLLDSTYHTELSSDLLEAFLLSFLSHTGIHVGPLVVLTGSSSLEVALRILDVTTLEILEPELSVLLLVVGCLLEDSSDLLVAVLAGLACEISILVASLALTCECFLQVLPCLCSFLILHNVLYLMFLYLLMSCIICSCISVEDTKK